MVTGTRAEYGLLRWVMEGIKSSKNLDLQIIATGMHLSPEFGLTYKQIEQDGFLIDKKLEILVSADTSTGITKSIGIGLIGFADIYSELKPDLILILGDRYEILAAAIAAMVARIPIGHLHGGEATEGLIDEPIRHSITKMSHLHFVAADEYKNRVRQLGENPETIFQVGGLGIDSIVKIDLFDKNELENSIGFKFGEKNLLVTFHPVTLEHNTSKYQMEQLLLALDDIKDVKIIFTFPNADTDGRILFGLIRDYVSKNSNSICFKSLGQKRYLSCLKYVDGVLGNSSSGLIEVPSFNKCTINIGDRQRGRVKANSVIDCRPEKESISKAINKLYSDDFQEKLFDVINPYGTGGASDKVVKILEDFSLKSILKKSFTILS